MSKIKVQIKERTVLELLEDAKKGDVIDLNDIEQVDLSIITNMINMKKDEVYNKKIEDFKKILKLEYENKIEKLNSEFTLKEVEYDNNYNKAEKEYKDKIKELNQKNENTILQMKLTEENKYNELHNKYELLLSNFDLKINEKENELEAKYSKTINELKNEQKLLESTQSIELEKIKANFELEIEKKLNKQKEEYLESLNKKTEEIDYLKKQKASYNIKQTGEDLESWCDNEVTSYMQNGLLNCKWIKDNKAVKQDGEYTGTKADYIFEIYATKDHNNDELLASVCLDMKDENPDSKYKKANADHYVQLDKNRIKKNCKYAILVSNLEIDKPNVLPIYKVREYDNMYVVRPAYLMTFLNMLTSLTTKFGDLLLTQKLELKEAKEIIKIFDDIKKTYLDKPLESLENEIGKIEKSTENIKKAATDIENTVETIKNSYINKIENKLTKFELQINKKVLKEL